MNICGQCSLLSINRSTLCHTTVQEPPEELEIMRKLDELYTKGPYRGVRECLLVFAPKDIRLAGIKIGA